MGITFRQLYEEHVRFVWRALRRLGVPESDVSDSVQDVFVVVARKLPEFEGRAKLTTWLFAICQNVASDRRRRAHVRREVPTAEEHFTARPDSSADVTAALERRQAADALERALDTLPEEQRVVFALFEIEGMDGEAIAELLDVPVGTVRSRLRLAREGFQRAVQRMRAKDGFAVAWGLRHA